MKVLTITIPTYNMEKYLENCLDSLIIDQMDKLEVLIVNDGSKDRSADIARRYVEKYPETFHLIDKENGGHGSTINEGIKYATGKYFKVLDSDDWMNTKGLEKFIGHIENIDTDLIITPYNTVNEVTKAKQTISIKLPSDKFNREIDIDEYVSRNRLLMHMITYRTNLLKEINLTLDMHMFYVDIEYMHFVLPYLSKCYCINDYLYQYRINQAEQSCSIDGYLRHRNEHAKVIIHCLKYRNHRKHIYKSKKLYEYAMKQLHELSDVQYRIYLSDEKNRYTKKEVQAFDRSLMKNSPEVYKSTGHAEYVKKLRESKFRFMKFQKLEFKYKKAKGIYKAVGMN